MVQNAGAKTLIGLLCGVGGFLFNCLTELVVVLGLLMMLDYISGMTAAFKNGSFDREKGYWGFIKKVYYAFLLLLAFLVDYTIQYMAQKAGIQIPFKAVFGLAATLYLIGTEGFSITQNLIIIGLPVPDYLVKVFGLIKDEAGKLIPINKEKKEGEQV